jgi:two-component system, OmpR family, phosphate regulon sensor histidine kinase PhoR
MPVTRLLFNLLVCLAACAAGLLLTSSLFDLSLDRATWLLGLGVALSAGFLNWVWVLREDMKIRQYVDWLRHGSSGQAPQMSAPWEEVVQVSQRVLRRYEESIRAEQDRLSNFLLALQASPNAVLLLDREDRIAWFNQTAAHFFGLQAGRDEGQIIGYLIRDPAFVRYLQGEQFEEEIQLSPLGSGTNLGQQISLQCHHYGAGKKLLLARDVTQIVRAEAMRRDFVANVSHEIRTPLTVLTGFVETMQHTPLSAQETERFLALMSQQGQRMKSLVDDLLTLSRLENSAAPGFSEWCAVTDLMQQCEQDAISLSAGRHQLTFVCPPAVQGMQVAGVASELMSAFSNLVTNAVRYTPAGGSVQVTWSLELGSGGGVFAVTDSGPGIAPEHLPRLTERFYRVDRSRSRETGGTGLGLAIVKHVVQRHGGELLISSQVGKGSSFSIHLPGPRLRTV